MWARPRIVPVSYRRESVQPMLFVHIAVALSGAVLTALAAVLLRMPILLVAAPFVASALVFLCALLVARRSSRRTLAKRDARMIGADEPKARPT